MRLWNYCAICGKRIEVGEPCLGIEKKNTEIVGDSICFDCVKVENINGLEKTMSITDLLSRAEAAEAAQETLQRAMAEYKARAEKAERERDAAVKWIREFTESIDQPCVACKHDTGDFVALGICGGCSKENDKWEWKGKEE